MASLLSIYLQKRLFIFGRSAQRRGGSSVTTLVHRMTSRDQHGLCTSHRAFYDNSPYSFPHFYCGYLHLCCFQGKLIQSKSLPFLTLEQMGTTGSSDKVALNTALPDIIARIKEHAKVPLAVGFGVSTRDHFNVVGDAGAEGVVIGSRLVSVIKQAPPGQVAAKVEEYCRTISLKGQPPQEKSRAPPSGASQSTKSVQNADYAEAPAPSLSPETPVLPARFGQFGGQYVPEALVDCLVELEQAHKSAMVDPEFWKEWEGLYGYMNRPSNLYFAEKLTEHAGGAKIWMKREDLFVHHSI